MLPVHGVVWCMASVGGASGARTGKYDGQLVSRGWLCISYKQVLSLCDSDETQDSQDSYCG